MLSGNFANLFAEWVHHFATVIDRPVSPELDDVDLRRLAHLHHAFPDERFTLEAALEFKPRFHDISQPLYHHGKL
jgi:hypothetical protein